jgi:hypothetical protein
MNHENRRGTRVAVLFSAGALLLLAAPAAGQNAPAKPASSAKPAASTGKPAAPAKADAPLKLGPAPDKKTIAKFGTYITMMNAESGPIFSQRSRWVSHVKDLKAGPTCDEANTNLDLYPPDRDSKAHYADYRKRLLEKPKVPGDEHALAMLDALEQLLEPRMLARVPYTTKPDEKAKNCANVQQVHPKLMAGWAKYIDGYRALNPLVEKFTAERDLRELQDVQKTYGKRHRYQFQRLILAAKALIASTDKQSGLDDPDSQPIKDALATYQQAAAEAIALYEADDPAKDLTPPSYTLMLVDSTPDLTRTIQRYVNAIDDRKAKSRPSALAALPKECITSYNKLVDRMNNVKFTAKQK